MVNKLKCWRKKKSFAGLKLKGDEFLWENKKNKDIVFISQRRTIKSSGVVVEPTLGGQKILLEAHDNTGRNKSSRLNKSLKVANLYMKRHDKC